MKRNTTTFLISLSLLLGLAHWCALTSRADGTHSGSGQQVGERFRVPAIAAGADHSLVLKSDGTVVAWGNNSYGQTNVPAGLSKVTALAAGSYHNLALKSDGTVVAWGRNAEGQTNVPVSLTQGANGVAAWGYNAQGQTNVPAELSNVTALAAGAYFSLALKSDGTVVAWGLNDYGQTTIPAGLSGVTALAGGALHSLVLRLNSAPTISGATLTRTAGSPGSNSQIATVNDTESGAGGITVTITSANPASGVTISNLSNSNGVVTADVKAVCGATNASFTLTATDGGGATSTSTLTVNVNANTPPTLSYPSNPGTTYGTALTVTPLTGPSDNGTISSVTVQSITPSNPGGITVNSAGVVSVAGTVPAGMYTVTIRAVDDCGGAGGTTDASFTLGIVRATPVITWNNPADITYGTALSATQLNATANVPGTFTYTPAVGTVLNAGNGQMLSVTFTPTNPANYHAASKMVLLNVLKAPLTVTVNNAFRNQGEANPPFSGSLTGLKNGDNITASYSTSATIGSVPGTYPITATLVDPNNRLSNYSVTNNPGTLTILNSCGISLLPNPLLPPALALPYAQSFSASPVGSYTLSLLAGTLPPGLSLVNTLGIYSLRGTPTTPGTFTFTLRAQRNGSSCEAVRTYTSSVAATVVPQVNCKIVHANGSYTVWFGYENTTGGAVTIPVGANNTFTSGAADRGQTAVFQPGVVNNAFSVTFASAGAFTSWSLKGPDGALRSVTPSVLLPNCP